MLPSSLPPGHYPGDVATPTTQVVMMPWSEAGHWWKLVPEGGLARQRAQ